MLARMAQCENGCTYVVQGHRDSPGDPQYPIVVCPICMTRWFGHRDDRGDKRPDDTKLPAALRDAILLDQAEAALEILENDLGYTKARRPNAMIGASYEVGLLPDQSAMIHARPQCYEFTPTHFVTLSNDFWICDLRVGNASLFLDASRVPSEAYRLAAECPGLRLRPGQDIGNAFIDLIVEREDQLDRMPAACSAFKQMPCVVGQALVVVVENRARHPQPFTSWFLGIQRASPQRSI